MSNEMNRQLKNELDKISFDEIANNNISKDNVTTDLSLYDGRNTQFGYADVVWKSSLPEIVSPTGFVMCSNKIETVTLTAVFTFQDYKDLKGEITFEITVQPSKENNVERAIDKNKIRIFIAGDSTACNYPHTGENNRYPQTGWGQVLGDFFNDDIIVVNCAISGRSSRSFLTEEKYQFICDNIQDGDYLFIQFAHNDCKSEDLKRYTSPYDNSYQKCIYKFIKTAQKVNANPVLCTSITRNIVSDTTLVPYANALKEIGEKENIPLLDLYTSTHNLLEKYGKDTSALIYMHLSENDKRFTDNPNFPLSQYYNSISTDNTHLNINGAKVIAKITVDLLKRMNHPLTQYLK